MTVEIAAKICEDRDPLVGEVSETHNAVLEGYANEGRKLMLLLLYLIWRIKTRYVKMNC